MCLQEDVRRLPKPFDPILILLDTHATLSDGTRVRLRLPQSRDRAGTMALLTRLGMDAGAPELDAQRALRFDPRGRTVVCATVWTAAGETVVGLGGITFATGHVDLLLTDEELAPGLRAVLRTVLAAAHSRHAAA